MFANSGELDQMPRFAASDLVLYCLPMSHKRVLGLYGLRNMEDDFCSQSRPKAVEMCWF